MYSTPTTDDSVLCRANAVCVCVWVCFRGIIFVCSKGSKQRCVLVQADKYIKRDVNVVFSRVSWSCRRPRTF